MQDLSQRDLIAYIIYTSDKIKEFNDKTIDNYLNLLFEFNLLQICIIQIKIKTVIFFPHFYITTF